MDFKTCREDWIRTSDPTTPSRVRYRTALHPDCESECDSVGVSVLFNRLFLELGAFWIFLRI